MFCNAETDERKGYAQGCKKSPPGKNAGLLVDLDFMFGDTWNSVGVQKPPAAWAHMSYAQMLVAMRNYVSGFMKAMKASNVAPTWVQIGNEENQGIFFVVCWWGKCSGGSEWYEDNQGNVWQTSNAG